MKGIIYIVTNYLPGMIVYGIPVGSNAYVRHMLEKVVDDVAEEVTRVHEVLAGDSQAM